VCHYINRFKYWIVYTCAYRIFPYRLCFPEADRTTPKWGLDSDWTQMDRRRISLPESLALHIQQDDYQFVCCDRYQADTPDISNITPLYLPDQRPLPPALQIPWARQWAAIHLYVISISEKRHRAQTTNNKKATQNCIFETKARKK